MQFLLLKPQLLSVLIPILFCQTAVGYGYHQVKTSDTEGVLDNGRASMQVADCLIDFYSLDKIYHFFKKYLPHKYDHLNVNYKWYTMPGETKNGNEIIAVHITGPPTVKKIERKKIYIQCLIHGREWATGTACMCYTQIILNNYEKMTKGGKVKNNYFKRFQATEFIIVPVVNPDGYQFTWTEPIVAAPLQPRLWRVNCNPMCKPSKSEGVDINRNFNIYPGIAMKGYLKYKGNYEQYKQTKYEDICHQIYLDVNPGEFGKPELETKILMNYIKTNLPIAGIVDIHTAAQTIYYPITSDENDNTIYTRISTKVATAMSKNGQGFPFTITQVIPGEPNDKHMHKEVQLGGSFIQWASSLSDVSESPNRIWSIAMELRNEYKDSSNYLKFAPTKKQLPDIFGDAARGLQAFIREVLEWPEYQ